MFKNKVLKVFSVLLVFVLILNVSISFNDLHNGKWKMEFGQKAYAANYYYYDKYTAYNAYVQSTWGYWTYQSSVGWTGNASTIAFDDKLGGWYIPNGTTTNGALGAYTYACVAATNLGTRPTGEVVWSQARAYYYLYSNSSTGIYVSYTDKSWCTREWKKDTTLVQHNLIALDGTYPDNGYNSADGYWYVKGVQAYYPPSLTVNLPTSNQIFSENDTTFKPQITVSDQDNSTLTCKYYFDSETNPRETKTVNNSATVQTITFDNGTNMGTLSEGNHIMKCEVSDGHVDPTISAVSINVDKSVPTLGTVTVTSTNSSITVQGSASDSISGMNSTPYRYTIGTNTASNWITSSSYTQNTLSPNNQYAAKFEARDIVGHIASYTQNIYTKAEAPSQIIVDNATSHTLDVTVTDNNPYTTQYAVCTSDESQYVTPEGGLTSSPVWITLNNKKKTVTGLSSTTTYNFKVKARNGDGVETAFSSPASGTTLIPPPAAPTNLTAQATTNSIKLNWEPLMGITGYDVLVDGTNTVDNGTSTTYTHSGLNPGIQHKYKVRARNDGGAGEWSAELTKSTLPSKPDIPSNISAIASSNSVIVTWSPVSGATGYDVMVDGGTANGGLEINGPSTNYVHTGLNSGTHHTYKVRSINPGGKSDWSSEVSSTTLVDIPLVPTNLHATASQNQIALTWDAVAGAAYEVEADGNVISNISSTTYTHTNLTPNTSHTYRVRSKKMGTTSDWNAALNVSTLNNVFGTPTNLKAEATDTTISLSWDSVTDAAGYDIELDGIVVDNGTNTYCTHNGLTPGSAHTYRVRAKNGEIISEWSEALPISTYTLGTPGNLSATSTDTSITAVWEAVYGVSGYDIEMDGILIGSAINNTYMKDGLSPNSQHTFRVRAKDSNGILGGWSAPLTVSTLFNGASIPSGFAGVARNTSITLVWGSVQGSTAYDLEVDGALVPDISATKYVHNSLIPNTQHTYKVRAKTQTETGQWSNILTVSTLPIIPLVPTNITSSSTTTSITITWDSVANATGYDIEADGVLIDKGSGTSYLHTGLSPETQHIYRVRSKNLSGIGDWSQPISISTKSSTSTYTINSTIGDTFSLVVTATDINDPSRYTFTVTYNPDELEAIDLCGTTPRIDLGIGNIMGSDICITQFTPGTIVFTKTGGVSQGQNWSGLVNSIKFKAKISGQPLVTYSIQ